MGDQEGGKPLAIDLFCGLGGWTEGLLAEGYYVVGFDFDAPAPFQRHSPTSKAAAEQIEPTAGTLRRLVYDAICARPMTDAELQEALGLEGSTERPRRVELQTAGLIEDSGDRRPTPSGRLAVVWRATR